MEGVLAEVRDPVMDLIPHLTGLLPAPRRLLPGAPVGAAAAGDGTAGAAQLFLRAVEVAWVGYCAKDTVTVRKDR